MWSKSKYMQSSDGKKDLFSNFKTKQGESTRLIIHVRVTSGITDIWDNSSEEDGSRLKKLSPGVKKEHLIPRILWTWSYLSFGLYSPPLDTTLQMTANVTRYIYLFYVGREIQIYTCTVHCFVTFAFTPSCKGSSIPHSSRRFIGPSNNAGSGPELNPKTRVPPLPATAEPISLNKGLVASPSQL